MEKVKTPAGVTVSFDRYGSGPALVLVHGAFSDHDTNWELVKPLLQPHFTVYAVARRGRGETDATDDHSTADEQADVAAVVRAAGEPVFLLGHSYGAVCSLGAAALEPASIRKLVLYEHPRDDAIQPADVAALKAIADTGDLDRMVESFMLDFLQLPPAEVAEVKASPFWDAWIADAIPTLNDLRALSTYKLNLDRFKSLSMPVLLQIGTESPREVYATDALASVLAHNRIEALEGQAHEGMTTAPDLYAESVKRFLLD